MRPFGVAILVLACGCGGTTAPASHSSSSGSGHVSPIGGDMGTGTTGGGSHGASTGGESTGSTASSTSSSASSSSSSSDGASSASSSGSTGSTSASSSTGSGSTSSSSSSSSSSSGTTGAARGASCNSDTDCASGLCRPGLPGAGDVCVTSCTSQADCNSTAFFCAPESLGAATGYCVPRSPVHCAQCQTDADCGAFYATCVQAQGDSIPGCHVDCSLAGAAACPPDYTCASESTPNGNEMLCVPNNTGCLNALGGYCDHVTTPVPCTKQSSDGTCTGVRSCEPNGRFSACGATNPTCKSSCSDPDPTGCTLDVCGGAADTPTDCGGCGVTCPGIGAPNATVTCVSASCVLTCAGQTYDSDSNAGNGCEQSDTVDDHIRNDAVEMGNSDCADGDGIPGAPSGKLSSDARPHAPAITGFVPATGSAPDFFHTFNTGGTFCQDDFDVVLQMIGSAYPTCYKLSVTTTHGTWAATASQTGRAEVSSGSGSYDDNSDIYFEVEKTCSTAQLESPTYAITGHF
ncbi:MAG: hypothetical protein JST54_19220 [Deltaproteobacteria bacterium]|nr:hypothetical protein [Deltaproteobacteria bacterium]